jgi:hypothetical protein
MQPDAYALEDAQAAVLQERPYPDPALTAATRRQCHAYNTLQLFEIQ